MRAFTKMMAATMIAVTEKRDPHAANVGDCAGGCGQQSGQCVCSPTPGWPPGYPIPPGWFQDPSSGNIVVANPGSAPPSAPPGSPSNQPMLPPDYARPANMDMGVWNAWRAAGFGSVNCVPYLDAVKDCLFMKTIASALTAVGIGATVNIDVSPLNGWFDAYYIDVVTFLTGGVDAGPDSANMTIPTVVGCPIQACDTGLPINLRFFQARDACCCGRPFRAIIPRTSEGTPLRTAVTNLNAAAITAQVVVRGFCFSTRICV